MRKRWRRASSRPGTALTRPGDIVYSAVQATQVAALIHPLSKDTMSEQISIQTTDGVFDCYVARPAAAAAQAPVIVIIQEIFGVNAGIRAIADGYAAKGYIAIAPDLFWRAQPGLELAESNPDDVTKAFAMYNAYDVEKGVQDIAAVVTTARTLAGASGKVGVTGYCLGGLLTYLAAAGTDADAFAAYYGGGIDQHLDKVARITRPLLVHLAGDDAYIGADAQAAIQGALAGKPDTEVHIYPGCDHAFARPGGAHHDAAATTLANARTDAFFQRHLAN
jgi:carboxymethylenebutenolidase